jgi:hypothetical protein
VRGGKKAATKFVTREVREHPLRTLAIGAAVGAVVAAVIMLRNRSQTSKRYPVEASGGCAGCGGQRHRLCDLDAVDGGGEDAAGIASAFAGGIQPLTFSDWKSSPRVMRVGLDVRVSTPVITASSIEKPSIWRPKTGSASRIAVMA